MEIKFNNSKDKEISLPCVNCDNNTYHKVLCSVDLKDSDNEIDFFEESQIIMCQGCKKISFRQNWLCSEDLDYIYNPYTEKEEAKYADHISLYPSRLMNRKELRDTHCLPNKIRAIYKETHLALSSKMSILSGVGIRSLVEAVCNEQEAKGKNLANKIDDLVQIGVLTKDGAEILHSTRLLGNQAVHETKILDDVVLDAAMDVAEYLLKGVYILPERTKKLPRRIKNK